MLSRALGAMRFRFFSAFKMARFLAQSVGDFSTSLEMTEQFTIHNAQCTKRENFLKVGDFSTSLEMTEQFTMHNAQCTIKDNAQSGRIF
jgi:hypothetical protein